MTLEQMRDLDTFLFTTLFIERMDGLGNPSPTTETLKIIQHFKMINDQLEITMTKLVFQSGIAFSIVVQQFYNRWVYEFEQTKKYARVSSVNIHKIQDYISQWNFRPDHSSRVV